MRRVSVSVQAGADEPLCPAERSLVEAAREALLGAYAPYSHFRVGAAVRLADGSIVTGSNQENAAYPSGLCAERVALFAAMSQHPGATIEALAIAAADEHGPVAQPVTPCGACRQVMMEYRARQRAPFSVTLVGRDNTWHINDVADLLPLAFQL